MTKAILLFLLLFFCSRSYSDSTYTATSWRYMEGRTLVKIELDFGKWLVFMVAGNHVNDLDYVFSHGCVLNRRSGEMAFPLTDKKYVNRKDEEKILEALNLETLCNND